MEAGLARGPKVMVTGKSNIGCSYPEVWSDDGTALASPFSWGTCLCASGSSPSVMGKKRDSIWTVEQRWHLCLAVWKFMKQQSKKQKPFFKNWMDPMHDSLCAFKDIFTSGNERLYKHLGF